MDYEEFSKHRDILSLHLTYPELDSLHAIEDYVSDLELRIEKLEARYRECSD